MPVCQYCNKFLKTSAGLKRHIALKHAGEEVAHATSYVELEERIDKELGTAVKLLSIQETLTQLLKEIRDERREEVKALQEILKVFTEYATSVAQILVNMKAELEILKIAVKSKPSMSDVLLTSILVSGAEIWGYHTFWVSKAIEETRRLISEAKATLEAEV